MRGGGSVDLDAGRPYIEPMRPLATSPDPHPSSPTLPDGLVLFDGVCVFCSAWVHFIMARDHAERFRFASIQSAYGRRIATDLGIDPDAPSTNAVHVDGRMHLRSDAALAVLARLPGWGWTRVLARLPRGWRDRAYDLIARNRYRLFGRTETCMVPTPALRRRFIDGAETPPPC